MANTGLAMKLLGANVSLMGKIRQDAFGEMALNDRIFLHNPGANNTFCALWEKVT